MESEIKIPDRFTPQVVRMQRVPVTSSLLNIIRPQKRHPFIPPPVMQKGSQPKELSTGKTATPSGVIPPGQHQTPGKYSHKYYQVLNPWNQTLYALLHTSLFYQIRSQPPPICLSPSLWIKYRSYVASLATNSDTLGFLTKCDFYSLINHMHSFSIASIRLIVGLG